MPGAVARTLAGLCALLWVVGQPVSQNHGGSPDLSRYALWLMPLALPLMASSGASSLKTTLFTPFGSLKSKVCGAAQAVALSVAKVRIWVRMFFMEWDGKSAGRLRWLPANQARGAN